MSEWVRRWFVLARMVRGSARERRDDAVGRLEVMVEEDIVSVCLSNLEACWLGSRTLQRVSRRDVQLADI